MKCLFRIAGFSGVVIATPALAASEPFFSLNNTHSVELFAFLLFVGVLIYLKVPQMVTKMLDARAEGIEADLNEARALREEAQRVLASYERKQKEVAEHAAEIVEHAKAEAAAAAEQAKADLKDSIARRLQAAEDQITSAEAAAIREVRDSAITVAIGAAREVLARSMTAKDSGALIDSAIADVGEKLN